MPFNIAIGPRVRKSPFFEATVGAGVTAFSVYNHMYMPVSYGDQMAEYERLINGVAMWDVAVERQIQLCGKDAGKLAALISTRGTRQMETGQGLYAPICDQNGTLLNDPILLKRSENRYWFSIADSDILLWARAIAGLKNFEVEVTEPDVSPLAVQGPKADKVIADLFGDWIYELRHFWFKEQEINGIPVVLARSGWSKQGGFELYLLDGSRGFELWHIIQEAGRQ
jgi:glycine cleavage system aminomethyltransferase T